MHSYPNPTTFRSNQPHDPEEAEPKMLRQRDAESHPHTGVRYARKLAIVCLGLVAALGIAACGGGGIEGGSTNAKVETVKVTGKPSGDVTISNWPYYIDNKTVPNFEQATGVSVKYIEDINDNAEFFAKVQPLLAKGQSGGRSMFVLTDWMAKKMYDLGYLQNLDKSAIPNVEKNLLPTLQHPTFDPIATSPCPGRAGNAGLIVNKAAAPDVHSINDLFDPKYKGKVEMLTELRDTLPLVMLSMGLNAKDPSEEDYMKAIDRISKAVDSGQIRRFAGNDYTRDMANGDATAIIGWSGDAVQLQASNPNIEFRMRPRVAHSSPTHGDPRWGAEPHRGGGVHELRLRPEGSVHDHRVQQLHHPGRRRAGSVPPGQPQPGRCRTRRRRCASACPDQRSADLPDAAVHEELRQRAHPDWGGGAAGDAGVRGSPQQMSKRLGG